MAQQPNISKRPSGKPSKIIMSVALVIAFSLPYILVKNFAHQEKSVMKVMSLLLCLKSPMRQLVQHKKAASLLLASKRLSQRLKPSLLKHYPLPSLKQARQHLKRSLPRAKTISGKLLNHVPATPWQLFSIA